MFPRFSRQGPPVSRGTSAALPVRVRRLLTVAAVALGAMGSVADASSAQSAESSTVVEAPAVSAPATAVEAQGQVAEAPMLDRYNRRFMHIFFAFGLTWVLIGGYVISLGRRFAELEEEIGSLRSRANR